MQLAPTHLEQRSSVLPWSKTLTCGDIVSYRFPTDEPTPHKARPCLVLDILRKRGKRYAILAYGTTSKNRHISGDEIPLHLPDDAAAAGLDRPTRFVGARRITVSVNCNRFVPEPQLRTPVLGRLTGAEYTRAVSIHDRLREEAAVLRRLKSAFNEATGRAEQPRETRR